MIEEELARRLQAIERFLSRVFNEDAELRIENSTSSTVISPDGVTISNNAGTLRIKHLIDNSIIECLDEDGKARWSIRSSSTSGEVRLTLGETPSGSIELSAHGDSAIARIASGSEGFQMSILAFRPFATARVTNSGDKVRLQIEFDEVDSRLTMSGETGNTATLTTAGGRGGSLLLSLDDDQVWVAPELTVNKLVGTSRSSFNEDDVADANRGD